MGRDKQALALCAGCGHHVRRESRLDGDDQEGMMADACPFCRPSTGARSSRGVMIAGALLLSACHGAPAEEPVGGSELEEGSASGAEGGAAGSDGPEEPPETVEAAPVETAPETPPETPPEISPSPATMAGTSPGSETEESPPVRTSEMRPEPPDIRDVPLYGIAPMDEL